MRVKRWLHTIPILIPLGLIVACGASHGAIRTPVSLPPATPVPVASVTEAPTDTPKPVSASEQATRTAAPQLMPGVGGDLADFFIATISGQETKARAFLAPGVYAEVPNLREALGLPQSNGPYMIDSLPLATTGQRATVRTTIAYQGQHFVVIVTVVKVNGQWKISAVDAG